MSTVQDALIAELLGDVGALHDRIKELPDELERAVAPSLGKLVLATKKIETTITQLGDAQIISIQRFTAMEKIELREAMKSAAKGIVGETLDNAARALQASAGAHDKAINDSKQQNARLILVAVLCSVIAATVVGAGMYALLGYQDKQQATLGRAVSSIWSDLDSKTQGRIQAARERMQ